MLAVGTPDEDPMKAKVAQVKMHEICTITELPPIMRAILPDDESEDPEHPMTAVGLVLLSAVVISTTELEKLLLFTGYNRPFISAITFNMEQNRLWVDGRYDASTWLSSDGTIDERKLWDHVSCACGELWMPEVDSDIRAETCRIYWEEQDELRRLGRRK